MKEAYQALFRERTSAEERRDLNNTKFLFNDPEMRRKYDAYLVHQGLDDGIVAGLVEVRNNLPQHATAPVAKKIQYEVDGDNFCIQAQDFNELEEILLEDNDL